MSRKNRIVAVLIVESVFVVIIINSLLMRDDYFFLFINYTNVLISFLFSLLLMRRFRYFDASSLKFICRK